MMKSLRMKTLLLLGLLFAGTGTVAWAGTVTDEITASGLAATSTTYTNFSNVSFTSNAVYAGNSAKTTSGGIQLRSSNSNSGIVSTTSGGKLKSVTITVESGTNTIDVYGSNKPYEAANNLFVTQTSNEIVPQGTKIGSLSATGTITVTDNYTYVGIRSKSGAVYLSKVEIVWETNGDTPSYSVTYDANGGSGTMVDENSPYEANATVKLLANTFTAPTEMIWDSWEVKDASNNTITVTNNQFTMPAKNVTVKAKWVADPNLPTYNWVKTNFADLTSKDVFVIVGNNGSNYALPNDGGASSPKVEEVTISNDMITSTVANSLKWTLIGNTSNGYTFYPIGSTTTFLYCLDNNSGLRVGTPNNSTVYSNKFKLHTSGYLYAHVDDNDRYLGIYSNQDWRSYTSTTGNIANQTFAFYKRVNANAQPEPSIAASDVNIEYNATSGTITYTISNAVDNGTLSATVTEGDWLTLGQGTNSPISFTCSENNSIAARTATVTLTYSYGENKTVTETLTVTQAADPNAVNNISDITAAGTYTVKGTIVAKGQRGFIVGDGTGYVYYYNQNYTQTDYNIGDKVKLDGSVVVYGGVFEFNSSTTVTEATESNYQEEDPTILIGQQMDERVASTTPAQLSSYVQYQGVLTVDGTHYNITNIDGASTAKGSISFPVSTDFTSLNGKTVKITGYYVGVSSSQYYNTMIGSVEEVLVPSITVSSAQVAVDAEEHDGTLTLTYNNFVVTNMEDFDIQYYDAEGKEFSEPDWIEVLVAEQDPEVGEGYVVSYYMEENDGDARTAYFKVFALDDNELVYSNLVTVTQAANEAALPKTIVFGSATGSTKIDGKSITGTDSGGKTWTITTEGTTSFTQNASYSQVGSSNSPASSITFNLTLPKETKVVSMEAKFGGFNETAGNVTLKVGSTTVGSGSLSGTTDVTISSTSEAIGTLLTVNISNISKGVKCYYITYKISPEEIPVNLTATVTDAGWATYITKKAVTFPVGLEAYIVTAANLDNGVELQPVVKVAAGTPILLKGNAATYGLVETGEQCDDTSDNKLTVYNGTGSGEMVPWVLAKDTEKGACFKEWTGAKSDLIGRVVMWLDFHASQDGTRTLTLDEDGTQGISNIDHSTLTIDHYYDLQGRHVAQPTKGLYIVNGKKVIIK